MNSSPSAAKLGAGANSTLAFDLAAVRADFPILSRKVHGERLVYLDSAASAQKPNQVLAAMDQLYRNSYSNVHRGAHCLGQEVTELFEQARETVAGFIGAGSSDEITFTRGTTEAINLVASSYGRGFLKAGDEVILTVMEHHSNIVPWQLLRDQIDITIKVVPIDELGNFDVAAYEALLTDRTKLVAVTHVSNALGTIVPVKEVIRLAHEAGAKVLLDGSQAAPHRRVDVSALD
ncbi:MAG: aminotransferase class V-fold PLP-dependent enzyme, partial [Pseudomonadota bacterium]